MKAKLYLCKATGVWFLQFRTDRIKFSEKETCDIKYWCEYFTRYHGLWVSQSDDYDDFKAFVFETENQSRVLYVSELICKALDCELEL